MQKSRISKSALTSLVAGMLFFIPLITGLIALVFGTLALKAITKNNEILIGKGVALAGIVLGSLNLLVWSFVLFSNAVYTIQPNEEAVVFRGNKQSHVVTPGLHFLTPGIERVKIYDLSKVYSNNTGTQKYFLFNREAIELNVNFKWRICEPEEHADNFLYLDTQSSGEAISKEITNAIRVVLLEEKVIDVKEMETDKIYNAIRKRFEDRAKAYGVCLGNGLNNDKAMRFAIMVN
jgi:regulator of protease activity HflC (stomatin/prohibitin superfamily)